MPRNLVPILARVNPLHPKISMCILHTVLYTLHKVLTRGICLIVRSGSSKPSFPSSLIQGWYYKEKLKASTGREIAPNTGTNAPKFFTLATKSWKLIAKLVTRMFHHNLTKRYSELKRFAKINPQQTSSLSLFPKCSTCISIDN